MLAIIANWFRSARVGIAALFALVVSFFITASIGSRYCFAADSSWVARSEHIAAYTWLASGVMALLALRFDQKKRYAVITLVCWLPSLYFGSLGFGCW